MDGLLDEVFDGYQYHTCEASDKGFSYSHLRSELGQGGLNNLEIRDPPKTVHIKCSTRNKLTYFYLGRLEDQYYRITQKLSVYEPYFFYRYDSYYEKFSVFVIGKFYPYPNKQSTKYNAVVQRSRHTADDLNTHFRVTTNLDLSFDPLWGHYLLVHGEWIGSSFIRDQKRFLHFSKEITMFSKIKGDQVFTTIEDRKMTYELGTGSSPIRATGSLFMLGKDFYEARVEIPENSWRAFVDDFFTIEKFPFTNVPMAGFNQVLLQAIKTVKVGKTK